MTRTVIDRIREYAGKDRSQVVNPLLSVGEIIHIANHIQEIESSLEAHHRDLLAVHRVAACVAQVEPPNEEDTLTVRRVKQMAMMINQLTPVHEVNPRLPPVNWEGYYTKKGVTENWFEGKPRWYWCVVVAHDQGKAVVRTRKGHYHAHSPDEFEFSKEPEGHRV